MRARFHKLPSLRFEDQKLTSFAGLVLFQALFAHLDLKNRLKRCFSHSDSSSSYGLHNILFLLILHLLMGFRRLSDVEYYHGDPMVERLAGLRTLPDKSTISRALADMDATSVGQVRDLSRAFVLQRLGREDFDRLTLDFDGSVLSTKRHAEGSAVGFNKVKKGARSYYPLFCTVAQTGQFFDMHHRPGNVHDSNGAAQFIEQCLDTARRTSPNAVLESRLDSAFFSKDILAIFEARGADFSISVPFERFAELKGMIEARKHWVPIDDEWSYFETGWKPKSWDKRHRFLFVRKRVKRQRKGPLQLDLFEPRDFDFEYKVIVTNKREDAQAVIQFHNGRGSQEAIFGNAKQNVALGVIPTKRLEGNQIYTLCAMMAHNFSHELQMLASPRRLQDTAKRPAAWTFETIATLRRRIIQRAGRILRPQGKLTLSMSANKAVQEDLLHFIDRIKDAA
ncbi:MAG: IS1380 family transposase [Lentisphaeria bacterium]|nr:IS1380 family transposase [Lentisphaeria bacterium]